MVSQILFLAIHIQRVTLVNSPTEAYTFGHSTWLFFPKMANQLFDISHRYQLAWAIMGCVLARQPGVELQNYGFNHLLLEQVANLLTEKLQSHEKQLNSYYLHTTLLLWATQSWYNLAFCREVTIPWLCPMPIPKFLKCSLKFSKLFIEQPFLTACSKSAGSFPQLQHNTGTTLSSYSKTGGYQPWGIQQAANKGVKLAFGYLAIIPEGYWLISF